MVRQLGRLKRLKSLEREGGVLGREGGRPRSRWTGADLVEALHLVASVSREEDRPLSSPHPHLVSKCASYFLSLKPLGFICFSPPPSLPP